MKLIKCILPLATVPFLLACEPPSKDSTEIETSRIYAEIKIENSGSDYTEVKVDLKEGHDFGSSIKLVEGERITASFKDQFIILREDEDLLDIDYEGNLYTGDAGGKVTVVLERVDGERVQSEVFLPEPFEVTSPGYGYHFEEHEIVDVLWRYSLPSNLIALHAELGCTAYDDGETDHETENETWLVDDDGLSDVSIPKLVSNLENELDWEDDVLKRPQTCDMIIDLTRENLGGIATEFDNESFIQAKQARYIKGLEVRLN
ncbi:hypothetical protein [Kangiella shandongensis]|uniref:hypothetical protein n=1 Tax=Kangiella shandongensis TaxID=2763258 RepID=UPI001CBE4898|nr:hypothetical protein [Kangiella shandongensis]